MNFEEIFKNWTLEQKVEWALGKNICNLSNQIRSIIVDLKNENARLRCLALHAIHDLLYLEQLYTRKAADFYKQFLPKEQYWKMQEKGDRIGMHTLHYGIAYRKAKNELEKMED